MHFTILTIFPEFFEGPLTCGLVGKALESGLVSFETINPRDFALDKHRSVDDRPYGGGPGMVMALPPLVSALRSIDRRGRMLLLSPKGAPLTQERARELAREERVILVCGRYEGIDARLEQLFPLEPISVGDFVLNGGETGALCVIESVSRLLPGFMGHEDSSEEESFSSGMLEYPHYTRPEEYENLRVPEVLLSGDHARIAAWRREQALKATLLHRPDLLSAAALCEEEIVHVRGLSRRRPGRNLFLALVHSPVKTKHEKNGTVSLTNLDIHDIARVSCSYGIGGYYVVTPLKDQQRLAARLLGHWQEGPGSEANPDRGEALDTVRVTDRVADALKDIERRCGQCPRVVVSSARGTGSLTPAQVRSWLEESPVLLLLGTGHGLANSLLETADGSLAPIRPYDRYNHLSVRSAAAILTDRLLNDVF